MLARSRSGRACVATGGSLVLRCTRTAAPAAQQQAGQAPAQMGGVQAAWPGARA